MELKKEIEKFHSATANLVQKEVQDPQYNEIDDWYNSSFYPPFFFGKTCVIMPCQNRSEFLPHSLAAWLSQSYRRFELVIVDYGSDEPVVNTVMPIAKRLGATVEVNPDTSIDRYTSHSRITILRMESIAGWNMSHAINYGVRNTTSDLISIAGCDTVPDYRYLETAVHVSEPEVVASVAYGRLTFARPLWYQINGYQEFCTGWGGEDTDFRYRISRIARIKEVNSLLCPAVEHFSMRGKLPSQNGLINKFKCQQYIKHHGHIANYSIFPGNDEPISFKGGDDHEIWIGHLNSSVDRSITVANRCCFAGFLDDQTVYYILPQNSSGEFFSDDIRPRILNIERITTKKTVHQILSNIGTENWRDQIC